MVSINSIFWPAWFRGTKRQNGELLGWV